MNKIHVIYATAIFLFSFLLTTGTYAEAHNGKQVNHKSHSSKNVVLPDSIDNSNLEKVSLKIDEIDDADDAIEVYLRNLFPIISDRTIYQIEATKSIDKTLENDTLGIIDLYVNFYVPKNYMADDPKILWELNIPAFHSNLYQIYNGDTIWIDTWPNVVGKPSTRTFTGHYQAFRLRNWPYWKDPEKPDSVPPTPPGPRNPLGLFVVHYDENSARYFHGTNQSYLLERTMRDLSHGCVRNENRNIEKMKEFIIKKLIKNDDLSYWLGSKKSMIYEIKEADRFPVRIIYKTFDIDKDEYGYYVIFYKDIYSYESSNRLSEFDDPSLVTLSTTQNIVNEIKRKIPSLKIPDEKLIPVIESLVSDHNYYQDYYFDDMFGTQAQNN